MKSIKLYLILLLAYFAIFACSEPEPESYLNLTSGSNSLEIPADGGKVSVIISASESWSITCNEPWVNITPMRGQAGKNNITISASANPDIETPRYADIQINISDKNEYITVCQGKSTGYLIEQKEFGIGKDGGTLRIPLKANTTDYTCVVDKACESWISIIKTKSLDTYWIQLEIAENPHSEGREGYVTISYKNHEEVVKINQSQKDELIVTTTSYEIGSNGGSISIPVKSNIKYSFEVLGDATWLSAISSNTKSLETSYIEVSIEKNTTYDARVGQIKIIGAGKESFVTIIQNQLDALFVENTTYEIDENGGTFDIPIESNVKYEAEFTKNYDWIRFIHTATKSMEKTSLTIKVDVNDTYEDRIAEILVSCSDNHITKQIIVTQSQKNEILVRQEEYEVGKNESPLTVRIQHNVDVTVQVTCDWITSVISKALQTSDYNFIVKENTTGNERSGEIRFMSSDNKVIQRVVVKQLAYNIYKGNYTISSQDDISFLKDGQYSRINGNLSINDIPNVSDLDNLIEEITGDLSIYNISNFDGLYGLRKIGGDFNVAFRSSCNRLLSFEGLNNLEVIGGDFNCHYSGWSSSDSGKSSGFADKDFGKLNKLKSIGGDLIVELFPYRPGNLTSLNGLENLSSIGGGIHTEYLSSLEGLSGIKEVQSLYIEDASNIEGLSNLRRVCGDVSLINGSFESFNGLRNLESVDGDFLIKASVDVNGTGTVEKFSKITSFAGFDALREVTGDFMVYSYVDASYGKGYGLSNLNSFEGLNSLQRIGGNLKIMAKGTGDGYGYGDSKCSEAYCLNNLSSINIASLQEIGGDLIVDNWHNGRDYYQRYYLIGISDFTFSNLKTIGGDITYHYHLYDGASPYYEREGYGEIKIAPSKLQSVRNINAICSFDSESNGFSSLETVENLIGNGKGFPYLRKIMGSFTIEGADVTEIGSMPYLESIAETLSINNTKVTKIQSFNKLSNVGTILISQNSSLATIDGFSLLSQCNSIEISNSPLLKDFGAFVNAVKNGSSWYVTACGYNPTKYQMQNGQSNLE